MKTRSTRTKKSGDEPPRDIPASYSIVVPSVAMMLISGLWAIVRSLHTWSIVFSSMPPSGRLSDVPAYWGLASSDFTYIFVTAALELTTQLFIVYGASCLLRRRNYYVGLAAAVLSSLPFCSGCLVLGMPFGIWAIVMLRQPEVRAAFR